MFIGEKCYQRRTHLTPISTTAMIALESKMAAVGKISQVTKCLVIMMD